MKQSHLQVRGQGGDPRWIKPDRDMAYATPKIVSDAFHVLEEKLTPENRELAVDFARIVARYMNQTAAGFGKHEERVASLNELLNPRFDTVRPLLTETLFMSWMAAFAVWSADIMPRSASDVPNDISGVNDAIERLISGVLSDES